MKRIVLILAALTLTASTASAYVQPGHLPQTHTQATKNPNFLPADGQDLGNDLGRGVNRPAPGVEPIPGPTNPVPEPGTMLLASMGLIALGTAVRRRRH
jgi:hypothetical protein